MSSKIFKALSDQTRLKIVELLEKGEICACGFIPSYKKLNQVFHNICKFLENVGIIKSRKKGRMVIYSLVNPKIIDMIRIVKEMNK